jgi:hypothetical protein
MQVLLEALGEEFFSSAKQTRNKNKTTKQLSPYAKEFFRIFLKQKEEFKKPAGRTFFRPYDGASTKLGPWPPSSWSKAKENLKLGIIDFKWTPNWTSINESSAERPYFLDFMSTMHRQTQPCMNDPPMWLWICGSKEAEVQVSHYAHNAMYKDTYERAYSYYFPSMNERLEDRLANNKLARAEVHLIFLVKKTFKLDGKPIKIPSAFEAPNTSVYQKPCKYNELEYRITTTELHREMFCV